MDVIVNVVNQKLKIASNLKNYVEGSKNFVRFVFNLSNDWNGLTVTAQFIQKGIAYPVELDSKNSAYLPEHIVAGTCYLVLNGTGGGKIASTSHIKLTLEEDLFVENEEII